jgi:hypothetical protein
MEDKFLPNDHDRIIRLEATVSTLVEAQHKTTEVIEAHNEKLIHHQHALCKKLDDIKVILAEHKSEQLKVCAIRASKTPTWAVMTWLLGFFVAGLIGCYAYTYEVDKECKKALANIQKEIAIKHINDNERTDIRKPNTGTKELPM